MDAARSVSATFNPVQTLIDRLSHTVTPIATGSGDVIFGVTIQNDGKILAVGQTFNGSDYDMAVVRYNADMSVDTAFGNDGKVVISVGTRDDIAYSCAIDGNGKIVIAGRLYEGSAPSYIMYDAFAVPELYSSLAIVRLNSDGTIDNSFGVNGKVQHFIPSGNSYAYALSIIENDKIIVGGAYFNGINVDAFLARFDNFGNFDSNFGNAGYTFWDSGIANENVANITPLLDGKLLVGTYSSDTSGGALLRYSPEGVLDTSFGQLGSVPTGGGKAFIASDGMIHVKLRRYSLEDGSLDETFGTDSPFFFELTDFQVMTEIVQEDGKLVFVGSDIFTHTFLMMSRYNTDGTLDVTFGTNGIIKSHFGEGSCEGYAIAIQPDGTIVVGGHASNGTDPDFFLLRYDPLEDSDGDGIYNFSDNCPNIPNPDQSDIDGNGIGDLCESYSINASVLNAGGSISPVGTVSVPLSGTQTFTIAPDSGYDIDLVSGCAGTLNGDIFTTAPITADCDVTATFSVNSTSHPFILESTQSAYLNIQQAYNNIGSSDVIKVKASYPITEALVLDRNVTISLEGGYDDLFAEIESATTLTGRLIISAGQVIISNIIIR